MTNRAREKTKESRNALMREAKGNRDVWRSGLQTSAHESRGTRSDVIISIQLSYQTCYSHVGCCNKNPANLLLSEMVGTWRRPSTGLDEIRTGWMTLNIKVDQVGFTDSNFSFLQGIPGHVPGI